MNVFIFILTDFSNLIAFNSIYNKQYNYKMKTLHLVQNETLENYIYISNQHIFDSHLHKQKQKHKNQTIIIQQYNRLLFYGFKIGNIAKRI
jgi:hypothetical protein